jgi:hypothetical protein
VQGIRLLGGCDSSIRSIWHFVPFYGSPGQALSDQVSGHRATQPPFVDASDSGAHSGVSY